ncbi:hypothetical protein GCM10010331_41100 [Streptomyces xanthochromogenes]|uniref:hypothetical protein n=1 Tax=Streptomyces xanthochromogenes TaxID=67384 RepID=UPI0016797538|nr:hypothetical protein [Streptomyces xanthochromogenes]GHB49473.1 hypothetical protein GCM10010331_41100 [Streptomyces xanthochromogenes]
MFDYEIYKNRQAELLRQADQERLAGQARRAGRRFGRRSGGNGPEGRVSSARNRFVRAA